MKDKKKSATNKGLNNTDERNLPGKPPVVLVNKSENKHGEKYQVEGKAGLLHRPSIFQLLLIMAGIGFITWIVLSRVTENQLTNWDDGDYVTNNPLIRNLSFAGIKEMFAFSGAVMGIYHPLTIMSYAIEYASAGTEPFLYHFDSLLLHIINAILVYFLVFKLTKKAIAAIIAAVLFSIHPMHVESVAWVAGRKDVLYSMFYLMACITYVQYRQSASGGKLIWYLVTFILFFAAVLSKPVAVVFPITLLLFDYLDYNNLIFSKDATLLNGNKEKGISYSLYFSWLWDKIPFFIISIVFGLVSIRMQDKFNALSINDIHSNFIERIALGSYALVTYLWKSIVPLKLCCFYQYPPKVNGIISLGYFVYPIIVVGLIFIVWKFLRKNVLVVFGLLFFIVNIILLLQFIPVGGAIIAERYTYISYVGLFIVAGNYLAGFIDNNKNWKLLFAGMMVYLCFLGIQSNARCKVWSDDCSLWSDEIAKQPLASANEYINLGHYYADRFMNSQIKEEKKIAYDSAVYLLNVGSKLQPDYVNAYVGLAELAMNNNMLDEARNNYCKVLNLKDTKFSFLAQQNLARIYSITGKPDSAIFFFRLALAQQPQEPALHTNYGITLEGTGKVDSALFEFSTAIALSKDFFAPYLERGMLLLKQNQAEKAMADLNKAIQLNPNVAVAYFYRSACYLALGDKANADTDMQRAKDMGYGR